MTPLTHLVTFVRAGGGMPAIVRRHQRRDAALGYRPQAVAVFEPAAPGGADIGLRAAWWWTPRGLRRTAVRRAHPVMRGSLAVYYNGWALPLLAPGDGAQRRLAYLHSDWPGAERAIRAMVPWCDGILCVSEELVTLVRTVAPDFPAARIHWVHCPVELPAGLQLPRADAPRAAGLRRVGIVGRVEYAQKRFDRLPALLAATQEIGLECEWHILGDGRDRARVAAAVAGRPVVFHGWLQGADYWRQLAALDHVLFLTDYEGLPQALLEAMHAGAVPLYPRLGGQAERYAAAVAAGCVYPAGDMAAAAAQLQALADGALAGLRRRSREVVAGHTGENYEAEFARALRTTQELPPVARQAAARRPRWSDALPFAAIGRFFPDALWR